MARFTTSIRSQPPIRPFPLPSYARVTNVANGHSVVVRVNDRGPYAHGRVIDLSAKAADMLDYRRKGVAKVRVKYIGKARLDGRDERFLVASYRPGKGGAPSRHRNSVGGFPGVMIADARPKASVGSLPVMSFVKAPHPKDRPFVTGGVPMVIGALPQKISPLPATNDTVIHRQPLEPLSPSVTAEIKDGFIISSYVAGQRINAAHQAASKLAPGSSGKTTTAKLGYFWKTRAKIGLN